MSEHTPEPWTQDKYGNAVGGNGERIVFDSLTISTGARNLEAEANTRRLWAMINACAGIQTEALEGASDE